MFQSNYLANISMCQSLLLSTSLLCQLSDSSQKNAAELLHKLQEFLDAPAVKQFIKSRAKKYSSEERNADRIEKQLRSDYANEFKSCEAILTRNELLYGFECDMLFRLKGQIINIEIDGPSHARINKKRFCDRRDAYLCSRQVQIHREDVSRGMRTPFRLQAS